MGARIIPCRGHSWEATTVGLGQLWIARQVSRFLRMASQSTSLWVEHRARLQHLHYFRRRVQLPRLHHQRRARLRYLHHFQRRVQLWRLHHQRRAQLQRLHHFQRRVPLWRLHHQCRARLQHRHHLDPPICITASTCIQTLSTRIGASMSSSSTDLMAVSSPSNPAEAVRKRSTVQASEQVKHSVSRATIVREWTILRDGFNTGSPTTTSVSAYEVESVSNYGGAYNPVSWTFLGSDNGWAWTTLDSQTGQSFYEDGESKHFVVGGTPSPTPVPSLLPTPSPTPATSSPTPSPTPAPSPFPTFAPIPEPTPAPTPGPPSMTAPVSTILTSPVAAGETELPVESTVGFGVGNIISIQGGGNIETGIIASIGSIVLTIGLAHSYPANSTVSSALETSSPMLSPTPAPSPSGFSYLVALGSFPDLYYRFDVHSNSFNSYWCIDELKFYGPDGGLIPVEPSRGGAQTQYSASFGAGKAFGEPGYYCSRVDNPTGWIQYRFATTTSVSAYEVESVSNYGGAYNPVSWTFLGSDNGWAWTTLDSQTGQSFSEDGESKNFVVGATPSPTPAPSPLPTPSPTPATSSPTPSPTPAPSPLPTPSPNLATSSPMPIQLPRLHRQRRARLRHLHHFQRRVQLHHQRRARLRHQLQRLRQQF
ncbi:unnamed protein product [Prorocentrum cordatum]|uniref:Uncharacterized protein n=1 Tax=Prorocentrum cordatum TaxID=2364126 RepID=A0ABN9Y850_9DINO|nr:unnamed protein product [Polarella glacialis]